jgi:hypothetical protein
MADWELQLAASAQHLKKILFCILLTLEKVKIESFYHLSILLSWGQSP